MNKFVTGALALAVAGSAAYAEPPNSDWLELDSEINTLASSVAATGDFVNLKVLLRGGYTYGSDGLTVGGEPVGGSRDPWRAYDGSNSGVRFWDVELNGGAQIGDVQLRLGFDFARILMDDYEEAKADFDGAYTGVAALQDAYAMWACGDNVDVIAGQYKPHITRSNYTDPENLFFLERSVIGSNYDWYDYGIGARGSYEAFGWNIDVMNGPDMRFGLESGHVYVLRGLYNFGRDAGGYETDPEDAFGAGDELVGTVGVFYQTDDIWNSEGGKELKTEIYGLDGQGTYGQFGFGFEYLVRGDHSNEHFSGPGWNALLLPLEFAGDSNPFMVYGTYMINDQWGVGVRYEDMDNGGDMWASMFGETPDKGDDNDILTLGVNRYDVGHNGKIGANIVSIGSDRDDSTVFQVGYTYGASR